MNDESARLETFKNWPSNAALSAQRVAKAGFYYSGRNLRVVCFSCACFIDDWQYGDQAMARHREANPLCPFVLNPELSGNIPLLPTSGNSPSPQNTSSATPTPSPSTIISSFNHSSENAVFLRESVRLSSFGNNWPSNIPISPSRLARAGFYYTNVGDKVQCAFCQGILSHWESGDDPEEEHSRHFPHCSFIKNPNLCGNITSSIEPTWNGLIHHGPKNPNYVTYESRLNSYSHWPEKPQKPEQLADAGLYYTGMIDEVRCFHCDGGLKNWLPEDEPWIEHARWFPKCAFVRLRKGESFIQEVMNIKPPNLSLFEKTTDEINKETIDILMESELVKEALELGLEINEIRITLENRIASSGDSFTSLNDLVDAVLDNKVETNTAEEQEPTIDAPSNQNEESEVPTPRSISNSHSLPCLQTDTISRKVKEIHGKSSSLKNINQETDLPSDLEEENRKLKEARTCKICMDAEVGVVYVPCGHLVTCINCAASLEYCPMCRVKIQASVKTYLS